MKTIEASFEIVTPMFMGSRNVNDVELRPPSIKGALRFWWRALHWGTYLQASKNNEKEALKELYKNEARLFGAAVKDQEYGQGAFFLKLKSVDNKDKFVQDWPKNNDAGSGYIGFGLDKTKQGDPHRKALLPTKFKLNLILKNTTEEQTQQLKNTLIAWGLLGGLGSRARRGFGSVALIEMDKVSYQCEDKARYYEKIRKLIDTITLSPPEPIFTALNEDIKIVSSRQQNKGYKKVMDDLGSQYKKEREDKPFSEKKVYGLPLMKDKSRRSSPLFFHVHKLDKTGYIGIFTFIPAKFHPDYDQTDIRSLFGNVKKFMDNMESIYP